MFSYMNLAPWYKRDTGVSKDVGYSNRLKKKQIVGSVGTAQKQFMY